MIPCIQNNNEMGSIRICFQKNAKGKSIHKVFRAPYLVNPYMH